MLQIFLIVLAILFVLGIVTFMYSIATAEEVDPKAPFLRGDADFRDTSDNAQ